MKKIRALLHWIQSRNLVTKIVLIVLLVGGGWLGVTKLTGTKTDQAAPQTTAVSAETMVIALSSSGTVTSSNSRAVTTSATGVVKKILGKNGAQISSGAPLLELELDQESKQSYTAAQANYQSSKNNLETARTAYFSIQADMLGSWDEYKVLAESDTYKDTGSANRTLPEFIISQNSWLSSEAKYKQQQAVVSQAQTALSNATLSLREVSPTVYAPIAGTISGLSLQVGSVLAPNTSSSSTSTNSTKLANITTTARPTITIELTEIDVTKIQIGDKATITADALPEKTFTGSVVSIDTVGAVNSGVTSYPAVIMLDTDVPELLANMSVTANVITDTKHSALVVPSSAVSTQNGVSTITLLRDGQLIVTPVETGLKSDTQIELLSGASIGDQVVTSTTTSTTATKATTTTSVFGGLGGGTGMRMR